MNSNNFCVFLWTFPVIIYSGICSAQPNPPAHLALYSPGDAEYLDVIVRRVGDNLTLHCELRGDTPRYYVWNYVPTDNTTDDRSYKTESIPGSRTGNLLIREGSVLTRPRLELSHSGHYLCSAPPHSATKYLLVQEHNMCARGAFWCSRCVLGSAVCDGYADCVHGEDEAPPLCAPRPCHRPDKLNCSSGRCISEAACCRAPSALCQQHSCCDEHNRYSRLEAGWEEYPPLYEDRHAPDEYGFIQSTIYTVTACALIFMIAVVLLVSAICKMHMKRAALRSYTHVRSQTFATRQMHRFPPCYEASRLLEAERAAGGGGGLPCPGSPGSTPHSPLTDTQWRSECGSEEAGEGAGTGLARLSSLFTNRYRQVATECLDVELRAVRASSANSSPIRSTLTHYRSPTSTDLNAEYYLPPDVSDCGRDLNYMATPVEYLRRQNRRPITLQLGRFQFSIPRLGRRNSDRRPDTPNVAEISIDDLDFVRLNSNETYTLNGRTIRLLGADFENYPVLNESNVRPPPYTEAMRYKLYGPPPEYLSRDALNNERVETTTGTEERARENVEMPPCYDELGDNDSNGNNVITVVAVTENTQSNLSDDTDNNANNNVSDNSNVAVTDAISAVINDLPAIDDVNANGLDCVVVTNNVITDNHVTVTNNNEG